MSYARKYVHKISFDGINFTPVKLSVEVTFTEERERDQIFYRKKSSTWKLNFYRNKAVYYTLLNYIQFPETLTTDCIVQTWRSENGVTLNGLEFSGYFDQSTAKVNQDDGSIEFTPSTYDDYTWYDKNSAVKINVFYDLSTVVPVAPKYFWETTTHYLWQGEPVYNHGAIGAGGYAEITQGYGIDKPPPLWESGKIYRPIDTEDGWVFDHGYAYRCVTQHVSSSANEPVTGSPLWQEHVRYYCFAQQQSPFMLPGMTQGNDIYDTGFPNITGRVAGSTNCPSTMYFMATETHQDGEYDFPKMGYKLFEFSYNENKGDILHWMINSLKLGLTYDSTFFTAWTNPITGQPTHISNPVLISKKQYKALLNADFKVGAYIDNQVTFKEIFDMISVVFNVKWVMNGKQILFEHIKYFDNGYSYSGTRAVGVNLVTYPSKYCILTDINGNQRLNLYSFASDGFPSKETWVWDEGDESTASIDYLPMVCKKGDPMEHKATGYMADIGMCMRKTEDINDSGWVILACDLANAIWKRDLTRSKIAFFNMINNTGGDPMKSAMIDNGIFKDMVNGDMFWENLIMDFHFYHRYFTQGMFYDTLYNMNSVFRVRRQENVKFPRLETVDTKKLIKTNLGNGEVEKLELSTDTDFYKTTLRFGFHNDDQGISILRVDSTKVKVSSTIVKVSKIFYNPLTA
jgi:hypothetical protein